MKIFDENVTVCGHSFHVTGKRVFSDNGTSYDYLRTKVNIGRHPESGKIRQVDVAGRSLDEIRDRLENLLRISSEDANLIETDMTFEEWVQYGIKVRKNALEPISIQNDMTCMNIQVLPFLGKKKLTDMTEEVLIEWQELLLKQNFSEGRVSAGFVKVSTYLELAALHRYLPYNPCRFCRLIRLEKTHRKMAGEEVLRHILVENREHPYSAFFAVTLLCALRFSEALALSWKDVDFENRQITVHQQIERSPIQKEIRIKPYTKTKTTRVICAPACVFWYLDRIRNRQEQEKKAIQLTRIRMV